MEALLAQVPASESDDMIRREQRLERFGRFAFGGFGIVVLVAVAGLIYTILTRMVLSGSQPWVGVLLTAFILFAALTLTYVGFAEDLKSRRKKAARSTDSQPLISELERPAPTAKLLEESQFEPAVSVVENTTELLPAPNRER